MSGRTAKPRPPGPLSAKVLEFMATIECLVARAKQPDFRMEEWEKLKEFVEPDGYERIAANRETRGWDEDLRLRDRFARIARFETGIRRIAEAGNVVYLDLVEHIILEHERFAVNSLGVFEFNDAGKLCRNISYQQWDSDRLPGHAGRAG